MLASRCCSVASTGVRHALAVVLVATGPTLASAESSLQDQVRQLHEDLARLRDDHARQVRELQQAIDELTRRQRANEAAPAPGPGDDPPAPSPPARRSRNAMNPAISVIADFTAMATDEPGVERDLDVALSEIEFGFQADVDPYLRFDVFAAFHEHSHGEPIGLPSEDDDDHAHDEGEDEEHGHEEGGLEAELEEAFVTTLGLPAGLKLRAGRYRQAFGKQNQRHPHEDPWVDQPTVSRAFFGDDQLIDDGLELSWLLPTPFFWELTGSAGRGPSESPTFTRSDDEDLLVVLRNAMSWDLGGTTTLELAQSFARGPAGPHGERYSEVLGVDLTVKWVPSTWRSLSWQTEVLWRERPTVLPRHEDDHDDHGEDEALGTLEDWGLYSSLEVQLSRRWFVGARFDWFDYDGPFLTALDHEVVDGGRHRRVEDRTDASLFLTWWPSEFQTLRLQARRTWDDLLDEPHDTVFLNWIWAHGRPRRSRLLRRSP